MIEKAVDGLKTIRRRFLDTRAKRLARFKKDTDLWGAFAARDGFPAAGSNRWSFSDAYGDLATVGKTGSTNSTWLYIWVPSSVESAWRYIGHWVTTSRLQADQHWNLGVDLCGGLWKEMAAAVRQAYVKFDVKSTQFKHLRCDFFETGPDNTCEGADATLVAVPGLGELSLNPFDAGGRTNEYYASGADIKQMP